MVVPFTRGCCFGDSCADPSLAFFVEASAASSSASSSSPYFMASKIIANLIVLGSGVLLRAFSQAYRQAIVNASKTGVAQETVQNMVQKSSKAITEHESRMILGVSEKASVEEMLQKYETLFERNAKGGSFYLQSKVQRAKECLEAAEQAKIRDKA